MPRTQGGRKVSSLPPRPWAGEPRSWCMSPQVGVGGRVCGVQGLGRECGSGPAAQGSRIQPLPDSTHRESADKVVLHTGKYEELIVCSHEIAASTAQLVAASKVRLWAQPGLSLWVPQLPAVAEAPRGGGVSLVAHPDLPPGSPGEGRQAQPPPESPAGVLTHRQRDGCQRGGLHQVRPGTD